MALSNKMNANAEDFPIEDEAGSQGSGGAQKENEIVDS
jgi:hypothetical protein